MLSVEEAKDQLNAPFEEEEPAQPARCYSRRDAEALRRQAYRFLRPLVRERDTTDDKQSEQKSPN